MVKGSKKALPATPPPHGPKYQTSAGGLKEAPDAQGSRPVGGPVRYTRRPSLPANIHTPTPGMTADLPPPPNRPLPPTPIEINQPPPKMVKQKPGQNQILISGKPQYLKETYDASRRPSLPNNVYVPFGSCSGGHNGRPGTAEGRPLPQPPTPEIPLSQETRRPSMPNIQTPNRQYSPHQPTGNVHERRPDVQKPTKEAPGERRLDPKARCNCPLPPTPVEMRAPLSRIHKLECGVLPNKPSQTRIAGRTISESHATAQDRKQEQANHPGLHHSASYSSPPSQGSPLRTKPPPNVGIQGGGTERIHSDRSSDRSSNRSSGSSIRESIMPPGVIEGRIDEDLNLPDDLPEEMAPPPPYQRPPYPYNERANNTEPPSPDPSPHSTATPASETPPAKKTPAFPYPPDGSVLSGQSQHSNSPRNSLEYSKDLEMRYQGYFMAIADLPPPGPFCISKKSYPSYNSQYVIFQTD